MISVITPFLNESENIFDLLKMFEIFTQNNSDLDFEFILVDDGSTDNSLELLKGAEVNINVKVIKLSRNSGSHAALRAGIENVKGDEIVFYYADMQDPINVILDMRKAYQKGNDIVWATRKSDATADAETRPMVAMFREAGCYDWL